MGRIEESIAPLTELIDSGEQSGETLYRYGRALSLTGRAGRAIWALDAAREDPDWFVFSSHQLALNATNSGNFDLALQVLEKLRTERTDSHAEDLPARLLEARVLLKTRRFYQEALDQIELILDDEPENEEATRLKAVALLGLKEPDEAYELIRDAGILLADLDTSETDEEAEATIEEAEAEPASALDLDLAPDTDDSTDLASDRQRVYWCAVRVTFKREAGEIEEAREIVDGCLAKFPSSPELLNEALEVFKILGRYDRILELLRAANEADPTNRDLRNALASHLAAIGLSDEANSVLRKALDEAKAADPERPIETASIWADLAARLIDAGRLTQGLKAYDEAIAILGEQTSPELRLRYADALILAERYDDAIAIANETPVEVHAPMLRGRIAFERGDYETALTELDRAAVLWPNNAPTRYYLARTSEGLGDFDRAVEEYRQAMRSDPTLLAARERLVRLHLAEGRVRDASTIHHFNSPKKKSSSPSLEMKLLAIEIQARLGNEPDLSIPENSEISLREVQIRAVESLARGLKLRLGAREASEVLAKLEGHVDSASKDIFVRQQVELFLDDNDDNDALDQAVAIARRATTELAGRPLVSLALGRALLRAGTNLDEAEVALRSALEADPGETDALASLAELAALRGDDVTALLRFDEALALAPDHWQSVSGRFSLLLRNNRRAEAIATLEAYVNRENPYDGRAALALARALDGNDSVKDRRTKLTRRAIRFGAGPAALELLTSLDPEAAARFKVQAPVPTAPESEPGETS